MPISGTLWTAIALLFVVLILVAYYVYIGQNFSLVDVELERTEDSEVSGACYEYDISYPLRISHTAVSGAFKMADRWQ